MSEEVGIGNLKELLDGGKINDSYHVVAVPTQKDLEDLFTTEIEDFIKDEGYTKGGAGGASSEEITELKTYIKCLEELALGTAGASGFGRRRRR